MTMDFDRAAAFLTQLLALSSGQRDTCATAAIAASQGALTTFASYAHTAHSLTFDMRWPQWPDGERKQQRSDRIPWLSMLPLTFTIDGGNYLSLSTRRFVAERAAAVYCAIADHPDAAALATPLYGAYESFIPFASL